MGMDKTNAFNLTSSGLASPKTNKSGGGVGAQQEFFADFEDFSSPSYDHQWTLPQVRPPLYCAVVLV